MHPRPPTWRIFGPSRRGERLSQIGGALRTHPSHGALARCHTAGRLGGRAVSPVLELLLVEPGIEAAVCQKLRVRAALKPGWRWSHKTGTGQDFQGRIGGINDIGILTAPDGSAYTMAIMTVPSTSNGAAQNLMQAVAREVMASHEARRGGG